MATCAWRQQLEAQGGRRIPLPDPNAEDPWAAPGVNFAGPGWRGAFRMRPSSHFDLAAKLHDLAFVLNDLSIRFTTEDREQPSLSQKAKADRIFRIMTQFGRRIERGPDPAAFLYRNAADSFFDGDDLSVFRSGDGFRNPLREPDTIAYLNDPSSSLTIPYTALTGARPTRQVRSARRGETRDEADYMTEVPMDRSPGFWAWFQQTYAPVLDQILEIHDGSGSAACN